MFKIYILINSVIHYYLILNQKSSKKTSYSIKDLYLLNIINVYKSIFKKLLEIKKLIFFKMFINQLFIHLAY